MQRLPDTEYVLKCIRVANIYCLYYCDKVTITVLLLTAAHFVLNC
jgi:hypothetical protein